MFLLISLWVELQWLSEVSLNVCFMFFFCCIYRNAQSGSHGRRDVVAGQHQSNGILPSELRPPQLETSHSTADEQPKGIPFFHICQSLSKVFLHPFCFLILLITSCCIVNACAVLSRQIISVGNRAGLIDDVFNLARWVQFVTRRVIQRVWDLH